MRVCVCMCVCVCVCVCVYTYLWQLRVSFDISNGSFLCCSALKRELTTVRDTESKKVVALRTELAKLNQLTDARLEQLEERLPPGDTSSRKREEGSAITLKRRSEAQV